MRHSARQWRHCQQVVVQFSKQRQVVQPEVILSMKRWATLPETELPPMSVRLRARLLGMRVPEVWLPWAERDVGTPAWPLWRGLAATLWLAIGLILTVGMFALLDESLGTGALVFIGVACGLVIAMAVVMAHTTVVQRMAVERLRRGWRAHPWMLAMSLVVIGWCLLWLLVLRPPR